MTIDEGEGLSSNGVRVAWLLVDEGVESRLVFWDVLEIRVLEMGFEMLKLHDLLSTLLLSIARFLTISSNKGLVSIFEYTTLVEIPLGAPTTYCFQKFGFLQPGATSMLAFFPSILRGW
jgi:hypothetical protein